MFGFGATISAARAQRRQSEILAMQNKLSRQIKLGTSRGMKLAGVLYEDHGRTARPVFWRDTPIPTVGRASI